MAVHRAEVTIPAADFALPDPTSAGSELALFASYGFTVFDDTRGFRIEARVQRTSGEFRTQVNVVVAIGLGIDPFDNGVPTVLFSQTLNAGAGEGGAAWEGGGTLAVEKDTSADSLSFETPLGTVTTTLAAHGIGSSILRPTGIGIRMNERNPITTTQRNTVEFAAFWGSTDGERFMGAAMSEDQPGTWGAWTRTTGIGGAAHTTSFTQMVNSFEADQVAATNTPTTFDSYYREWQGGEAVSLFAREQDMCEAPEHGLIFRVYSLSRTPETLYWQRTGNNGATWTGGVVHTGPTINYDNPNDPPFRPGVVRTPNINWYRGRLIATWNDGFFIVQRISYDMGEHWEAITSILVGITGETPVVPRAVVHPYHGIMLYVFINKESGDVKVSRSGDFGATGQVAVTIGIGAVTAWLDAWASVDGDVNAVFQSTLLGALAHFSPTYGEHWDQNAEFPTGTRRQRSKYAFALGLSYHAFWDGAGNRVLAYASPNDGALPTPGPSAVQVANGLLEQTPAVAVLPSGGAMVSYFDANEDLLEKVTNDFGVTWDAA